MVYKGACLSNDDIIDVVAGNLSEKDKVAVEAHLHDCHVCNRNVSKEVRFEQRNQNSAVKNDDLRDELDEKYGSS